MPLPVIRRGYPTVRQVREQSGMSYFDVAAAAGVKLRVVYWMEHGIAVDPVDAVKILTVLSLRAGKVYTLMNVQGIRVKEVRKG